MASHTPGSAGITMSFEQYTSGSKLEITTISKLQMSVFPNSSVAVNSTVVAPAGKVSPEAGPPVCTTVTSEQSSVAVGAAKVTTPSQASLRLRGKNKSPGHSNTGSEVSKMEISNSHVRVFPAASAASNCTI